MPWPVEVQEFLRPFFVLSAGYILGVPVAHTSSSLLPLYSRKCPLAGGGACCGLSPSS